MFDNGAILPDIACSTLMVAGSRIASSRLIFSVRWRG
jgi:hypothetical protein